MIYYFNKRLLRFIVDLLAARSSLLHAPAPPVKSSYRVCFGLKNANNVVWFCLTFVRCQFSLTFARIFIISGSNRMESFRERHSDNREFTKSLFTHRKQLCLIPKMSQLLLKMALVLSLSKHCRLWTLTSSGTTLKRV